MVLVGAPIDTSPKIGEEHGMAQTKAYVLVEVATGHIPAAVAGLREIPGLVSVDSVMGPFDVLVVLVDDLAAAGNVVAEHVHPVSGVVRTVTCLVIG